MRTLLATANNIDEYLTGMRREGSEFQLDRPGSISGGLQRFRPF
jgi:hypothetical protein